MGGSAAVGSRVIHEGEARVQNGRHRPPAGYVCVDTGDAVPGQGSRSLGVGDIRDVTFSFVVFLRCRFRVLLSGIDGVTMRGESHDCV